MTGTPPRRRRRRQPSLHSIAALAIVVLMLAGGGGNALAAGHLNILNVEAQFECLSCHEPLNTVDSPEAISEKHVLAGLIAKGDNMQQITTAMVSIYGQQVLTRPPASGVNLLIYILPPALLVGGLGLLAYTLPRWRARARSAGQAPLAAAAPPSREEAARLEDELSRFT